VLLGGRAKYQILLAKAWHLRDIHQPNCHYLSAKFIVTQRDNSFKLLIFLNPEYRNTSDSEHKTFTPKKSRYSCRGRNPRLSCQKIRRIWGSGQSKIMQCQKSFKHLNKHSIREKRMLIKGQLTGIKVSPYCIPSSRAKQPTAASPLSAVPCPVRQCLRPLRRPPTIIQVCNHASACPHPCEGATFHTQITPVPRMH